MRKIAQYSQGIPRVVNIVCDHSLLLGYAKQIRRVEAELVQQAIDYLEEGESRVWRPGPRADTVWPRVARYTSGALVACSAGAAAMVAMAAYRGDTLSSALMVSLFNLVQLVLQWWRP
jgi:hypothetical protein